MITTFTSAELMLQSQLAKLDQLINSTKDRRNELIKEQYRISLSLEQAEDNLELHKKLATLDDNILEIDADLYDIQYERREVASVYARMIRYNKSEQNVEDLVSLFY